MMRWDWSLVLLALYSGVFSVLAVRTIVGTFGTLELTALAEREQNLVKNIELLRSYQKDLQKRIENLQKNQESQKLLARKLGYYQPGERRLVIYGDEPLEDQLEIGVPLPREERAYGVFDNGFWLFVVVSVFMYVFILASNTHVKRLN